MSKKNKNINKNKDMVEEAKTQDSSVEQEVTGKVETEVEDNIGEEGETGQEDKTDALEKEIEVLKASVAKEKDDYLRLMADFENFRRHSAEAKLELVNSASSEIIKGLLPVLDDCERALAMLADSEDTAAREGTELIYNKLMGFLKTKGLEPIKAKDEKFDTDFHEAVAQVPVPEEDRKGLVFDVVQTGYTLSGKVIRYAKVVVGI